MKSDKNLDVLKNDPLSLVNVLSTKEKITFSILFSAMKPLSVEEVRERYIDRLFLNILQNCALLDSISSMVTGGDILYFYHEGSSFQSKSIQNLKATDPLPDIRPLPDVDESILQAKLLHGSLNEKLTNIKKIYTQYKGTYSKLAVSRRSLELILESLCKMKVVNLKEDSSKIRKGKYTYYLAPSAVSKYRKLVLKSRQNITTGVDILNPTTYPPEEMIFYGLEKTILEARIKWLERLQDKIKRSLVKAKYNPGTEETDKLVKEANTEIKEVYKFVYPAYRVDDISEKILLPMVSELQPVLFYIGKTAINKYHKDRHEMLEAL